MTKKILNPFQKRFIDAPEKYPALFGGVGNGKTYSACLKIIEHSTRFPDNLSLVGRLTYPELRDSTRESFLGALREIYSSDAYKFNKAENELTFWNGSTVLFRHLDNWKNLLSMNLGAFYIDQAEEVEEDAFLTLQSRLRRPNVGKQKGYLTGNPKGFNWIYYKFGLDQAAVGTDDHTHNTDYRMICAPTVANSQNLPAGYIDGLKRSYSPEWFNRYVMGSWDAFEGQIFDISKITGYDQLPGPEDILLTVSAIDPAISKAKTACRTAITTLALAKNGHIYDLESIAGQWSFHETLEEIAKMLSRQSPMHLGVEDVAYQRALYEACSRYFPQINVHDLKADKDKFRRAKSVSHIVAKGLFHTNNKDLMSEISAFQPDAEGKERKDMVDALVHALHMIQTFSPSVWEEKVDPYKGLSSGEIFLRKSLEEEKRIYMDHAYPQEIIYSEGVSHANYY